MGAEVHTPFLRPVGVLAVLYNCSTVVIKIIFLDVIYYNKLGLKSHYLKNLKSILGKECSTDDLNLWNKI